MRVNTIRSRNLRLNRAAAAVLEDMRGGQDLRLEFRRTGPCWFLTGGQQINDAVARLVTSKPGVIGAGDSLFPDTTPQTWRLTKGDSENA